MKTIAALTMLFLPGTFLSSVFSMSMLDGAKWWLYVALALPLTLLIVGSWWALHRKGWEFFLPRRRDRQVDVTQV